MVDTYYQNHSFPLIGWHSLPHILMLSSYWLNTINLLLLHNEKRFLLETQYLSVWASREPSVPYVLCVGDPIEYLLTLKLVYDNVVIVPHESAFRGLIGLICDCETSNFARVRLQVYGRAGELAMAGIAWSRYVHTSHLPHNAEASTLLIIRTLGANNDDSSSISNIDLEQWLYSWRCWDSLKVKYFWYE